ncbi:MAG TPA: hypothetical protein VGA56_15005 [Opitutaceae bacterium]
MTTDKNDPAEESRPTLFGAIVSFALSMALVILLVAVAGQRAGPPDARKLSGTYVLRTAAQDDPVMDRRFSNARFGVRFLGVDRVEMRVNGEVFDAFYRFEDNRVVIETVDRRSGNAVWIFDLEESQLVSSEAVLARIDE